jgi:hypothetical protein
MLTATSEGLLPAARATSGRMKRFCVVFVTMLMVTFFSLACTRVEVYRYQYDSKLDDVFIRQDVDFSRYRSAIIDDVSVWYPDKFAPSPENAEKAKSNLAKAQVLFRESISNALSDRFTLTGKPGKDVLRLHVEFVDLRAARSESDIPEDLARHEFNTKPGHITMIGQLFDSRSGELLMRVADLGKQRSEGGNGVVDWDAIASDFEYWASVFSAWTDRIGDTAPRAGSN